MENKYANGEAVFEAKSAFLRQQEKGGEDLLIRGTHVALGPTKFGQAAKVGPVEKKGCAMPCYARNFPEREPIR